MTSKHATVRHVCQVPGCQRPAVLPKDVGYLCVPCRRNLKSGVRFSPVLFFSSLWIMSKQCFDYNIQKSYDMGCPGAHYRKLWTAQNLVDVLKGTETMLIRWWYEHSMSDIPEAESKWIHKFWNSMTDKSRCRVITTYWQMLRPPSHVPKKNSWLTVGVFEKAHKLMAQIHVGPSSVERVIQSLQFHDYGSGTALVLKTPWEVLFPPRKQLTEEQAAVE